MGGADHLDLAPETKVGRLEFPAELAIDEANRREVVDARESEVVKPTQEVRHLSQRVGAVHPSDHRNLPDDWQHLALTHVVDDLVGIAERQESG